MRVVRAHYGLAYTYKIKQPSKVYNEIFFNHAEGLKIQNLHHLRPTPIGIVKT
jgi:hypothetical protein